MKTIPNFPLMEAYKTLRRYGTIVYDEVVESEIGHTRYMSIIYREKEYMVTLKNGEVKSLRML